MKPIIIAMLVCITLAFIFFVSQMNEDDESSNTSMLTIAGFGSLFVVWLLWITNQNKQTNLDQGDLVDKVYNIYNYLDPKEHKKNVEKMQSHVNKLEHIQQSLKKEHADLNKKYEYLDKFSRERFDYLRSNSQVSNDWPQEYIAQQTPMQTLIEEITEPKESEKINEVGIDQMEAAGLRKWFKNSYHLITNHENLLTALRSSSIDINQHNIDTVKYINLLPQYLLKNAYITVTERIEGQPNKNWRISLEHYDDL